MQPLNRLLFSDMRRMWGQELAICAVLTCGIATFVMSTSTMQSLDRSRERYYRDRRFGDVFVQLVRAPNRLAGRLAEIPGVARVQTRVVRDVILDVPGMIEPASCRLVSVAGDPRASLNDIHLRRGRLPDPYGPHEVVASEPFAAAHGWNPGDEVHVIMGGHKQRLRIVGIAISPEYIYAVQPGQFLSDDRRFGILWMPYRQIAAAFNMEGAFNDATLSLLPGASLPDVLFHVDRLTETYGGRGAYGRKDQMSHRRIGDEMHQLQGMALVTPSIFLAVAVFLLNIVLARMVHHQQEQIATLRAFGYSRWEIGWYYVKFLLILAAIGAVFGCLLGYWLSRQMTTLYVQFFRFPQVHFTFAKSQAALGVLLATVAALVGGFSAVRRAVRLQPAVAMRPEAPPSSRASLLERLGLRRLLTPMSRMVLRRLERNPRSSALSVLGMAFGVAVLVLGTFMEDAIDYVIDVQFQRAQRQDVTLTFNEAATPSVLHDVHHLPGVFNAEPFRAVSVRMRHGPYQRRLGLMALEARPQLFRVLDDEDRDVDLTGSGVTISKKLAELLRADVGDQVTVELMEGHRSHHVVRVGAVFQDYTDPGAYMNRAALHRLLAESERHSGAFVATDPARMTDFYSELKQAPVLAGITVKQAAIQNFHDTIAASLRPMRMINAGFAFVIAFGVIYNCALIALAERSRDLATLRVMGFTRWEVSTVLLGELAVITLIAIPVGLPIGCVFSWVATLAVDTETHRIPLVLTRATLAYAAVIIVASAMISAVVVRRMLDQLDLIAVLKVKE